MNLRQLREEAWDVAREIDTPDSDRLWPLDEMTRIINRVYREIARETRCIVDSVTPAVCQIACEVVDYTTLTVEDGLDYTWANDSDSWLYHQNVCPYLYPLHASILEILEVKWAKRAWPLICVSVEKWQQNVYWEQTMGLPIEYALDLQDQKLALNFRATSEDTLRLWVKRLPIVDLNDDEDSPEYKIGYHDFMINGILMHMYSKQDSEAFDGVKAKDYRARYKEDIDEIKQQESLIERRLRPNNSLAAFR